MAETARVRDAAPTWPAAKSLKVLVVTSWYPTPEQPLDGVFVREHVRAAALYNEIRVLHCSWSADASQRSTKLEAAGPGSQDPWPTYRLSFPHRRMPVISYASSVQAAARAIRHICADFRPDLIHAHTYTAGVYAVATRRRSLPVVVTEHFTGFPRQALRRRDVALARFAFQNAALVLPVSRSLQSAIQANGIRARFRVVPNAVDTQVFHTPEAKRPRTEEVRILFVGVLDALDRKGMPELLQALSQLPPPPAWTLDVIGDGPRRHGYERMARNLGLGERVRFLGARSKAEVARSMQESDFLVVPSRLETFSVVTAEALATGLPVLVTKCGGPEEYVDQKVGMVVPPRDVSSLEIALRAMIERTDTWDRGAIARWGAENFGLSIVGQRLTEAYESVVAGPGRR